MNADSPFPSFTPGAGSAAELTDPEASGGTQPRPRKPRAQKEITGITIVNGGPFTEPEVKITTRKKPARDKHSPLPKAAHDLQKILRAAGGLRETDHEAFEHLLCYCLDLDKASRERVLKAVAEVFA